MITTAYLTPIAQAWFNSSFSPEDPPGTTNINYPFTPNDFTFDKALPGLTVDSATGNLSFTEPIAIESMVDTMTDATEVDNLEADTIESAVHQSIFIRFFYPDTIEGAIAVLNGGDPVAMTKVQMVENANTENEKRSVYYVYPYELMRGSELLVTSGFLDYNVISTTEGVSRLKWGVNIINGEVSVADAFEGENLIPRTVEKILVDPLGESTQTEDEEDENVIAPSHTPEPTPEPTTEPTGESENSGGSDLTDEPSSEHTSEPTSGTSNETSNEDTSNETSTGSSYESTSSSDTSSSSTSDSSSSSSE